VISSVLQATAKVRVTGTGKPAVERLVPADDEFLGDAYRTFKTALGTTTKVELDLFLKPTLFSYDALQRLQYDSQVNRLKKNNKGKNVCRVFSSHCMSDILHISLVGANVPAYEALANATRTVNTFLCKENNQYYSGRYIYSYIYTQCTHIYIFGESVLSLGWFALLYLISSFCHSLLHSTAFVLYRLFLVLSL
jgi:hypothetical protein